MSDMEARLTELVKAGLTAMLEEIRAGVLKDAEQMFRERVKQSIGSATLSVLNNYSIQTNGSELVIRVRIDEPEVPRA